MKIHFIAIGGAVMHNMAIALKLKGYEVSGSDDEIFDPAKSHLSTHGLLPEKFGWFPDRITPGLDAVILGMHAKPGNPELDRAVELGLRIYSFPEYLYEQSKNKTRVVIAGSHGKTTITSMIMHILKFLGRDFDYLVGARIEGFDVMVRLSDAPVIVIEGDEYLTSALDPRPKFLHYKPDIALISGIAWDHINVFPTWAGYIKQFELLIGDVGESGSLVYCENDPELSSVVKNCEEAGILPAKVYPYNTPGFTIENGVTFLAGPDRSRIPLQVFGGHNLLNLEGARLVCRQLGIGDKQFFEAIRSFSGAANRLEKIAESNGTVVFKDFAHAPSKLRATVEAVKSQYPERKLIAVMELHTYSSLSKHFLSNYRNSLKPADVPVVFFSRHALELKRLPVISADDVKQGFGQDNLNVFTGADALEDFLKHQDYAGSILLLMSSGNFGGIDLSTITSGIPDKS
jgi:UDP-N-acetylmuramate: L-alanyl-gamma-D-glutamyl-meso-diaminopimelate ligase